MNIDMDIDDEMNLDKIYNNESNLSKIIMNYLYDMIILEENEYDEIKFINLNNKHLWDKYFEKFKDKIDLEHISTHQILSESFIEKYQDELHWSDLNIQDLSSGFYFIQIEINPDQFTQLKFIKKE